MKQYSVDEYQQNLVEHFKKNNYSIEINENFLNVTNDETGKTGRIELLEDFDEEMSKIKWHDPYVVAGEGLISFILFDPREEFLKDEIIIEGEIKGTIIKANVEEYGVFYNNLQYLIDLSKLAELLSEAEEIKISDLIKENIIVVDLNFESEEAFYNTKNIEEIECLIDSILFSLKYQDNILLDNPRNNYVYTKSKSLEIDKISTKVIRHVEPLKYFLSAEELSSPHLKYIEYYHVLEFYFMYTSIKEFDKKIKDLVSLKLAGKKFENKEYYTAMQNAYKHFTDKDSTKEEVQIKNLFTNDIGYTAIASYINDNLSKIGQKSMKKVFLQEPIYGIEETVVSCYKEFSIDGRSLILQDTATSDKSKIFCEAIAYRIYKLRNFIVHTKKGERQNVFTPVSSNFELLESDLRFIRYLSSYLLLKMSQV